MKQLNEQLKDSIEAKTGTRPDGYTLNDILNSASGEDNTTLVDAVADFIENLPGGGGGSAPTVVDSITWDGDTTGLDTATIHYAGATLTVYKVSDDILPFSLVRWNNGGWTSNYVYPAKDKDGTKTAIALTRISVGALFAVYANNCGVCCAYYDGVAPYPDSDDSMPSAGTWVSTYGADYISSLSAQPDG